MKKLLAALLISGATGALLAIGSGLFAPPDDYRQILWLAGLGAVTGTLLGTPLGLMLILRMLPRFSARRDSFWLLTGAVVGGLTTLLLLNSSFKVLTYTAHVGLAWLIVIIGPLTGAFIASIFLRRSATRDRCSD